jgi:hypothetical protein
VATAGRASSSKPEAAAPSPVPWVVVACAVAGLAGLSLAPHQEPRFLLPLTCPLALAVGPALVARKGGVGRLLRVRDDDNDDDWWCCHSETWRGDWSYDGRDDRWCASSTT